MQVTTEIRSERAARAAFLAEIQPGLREMYRKGKPLDRQCGEVRATWCYWVAAAYKQGRMPARLADTVTI